MKFWIITICAICLSINSFAQDTTALLSETDRKILKENEQEMHRLGYDLLRNRDKDTRVAAAYKLQEVLEESLKKSNSFQYAFDSILHVSILYPADSSFRMFTWQLYRSADDYKYFGVIQMNSPEGNVYPLTDGSAAAFFPDNTTFGSSSWFGALYYNIKEVNSSNGKYYTLFGLDNNSMWVKRKIIDVLYFTEDGKPQFGAPIFHGIDKRGKAQTKHRVLLDYSAEGAISCNYSDEYNMIIFDNLIPMGGSHKNQGVIYVSDGSYRGYKYDGEKWVFVEKVFNDFQEDAPRETPVLDSRSDGLFGPKRKRRNR